MANDKQQIEIELTMRNMVMDAVTRVTNDFDSLSKKIGEGSVAGAGGLSEVSRQLAVMHDNAKIGTTSLTNIGNILVTMSKTLLMSSGGPFGLVGATAVGAVAVVKNFVDAQATLKNLSIDIGASEESIVAISRTFELLGYKYEEGTKATAEFGAKVKATRRDQREDETYKYFKDMPGRGLSVAEKYLGMVNADKPLEEIISFWSKEYIRQGERTGEFEAEGKRAQISITRMTGIPGNVLEGFDEARGGIVPPYIFTPEQRVAAERMHQLFIKARQEFYADWEAVENVGISAIVSAHQARQDNTTGYRVSSTVGSAAANAALGPFVPLVGRQLLRLFDEPKTSGTSSSTDIGGSARRSNREDMTPEREEGRLLDQIYKSLRSIELADELAEMEERSGVRSGPIFRRGIGPGVRSRVGGHGAGVGGGSVYGGSTGGLGGPAGANYMGSERAAAAGITGGGHVTVKTAAGNVTVNKDAAPDMVGAVNALVAAGAPVGNIGSYANRNIAGTNRPSQHARANAFDLFNQTGRGEISKEGLAWLKEHPKEWIEIKRRFNLVGGEDFGDIGHIEWGGPGFGEKRYGKKEIGALTAGSVSTGPLVAGQSGDVNSSELFRSAVNKFSNSPLNGFVPKDGDKFGIKTGSPEEWARFSLALGSQESSLNARVSNGLFQFGADDLKRYGVDGRVDDPDAQLQAMVNQFSRSIPKDGYIGGQDSEGWRGGARYFEPIRYPYQLSKHWGAADRVAAKEGSRTKTTAAPEMSSDVSSVFKEYEALTGRAMGGPVLSGRSYLVGEHGPEIMVPEESGNIISNRDLIDRGRRSSFGSMKPRINAMIDFKNAPAWVKTSVDAKGDISQLRVNKAKALGSRYGH